MNIRQIIALTIWWCEGTKPRRDFRWKNSVIKPIEIINTDFRIVKIFLDYLTKDKKIPIEKIKGQIQIHEGDNIQFVEDYWEEKLSLPKKQFNKTIVRPKGNKVGKNYGTFKLRLYDTLLYDKLEKQLKRNIRGVAQLASAHRLGR
jgi:hypothetical protein